MKGYAIPVEEMDNKNKFQEMLGDILEIARTQENQLGMNEIKDLFGDMNLIEAQYEHIFAYLAANHIKIKGYAVTENEYTKAVMKESEKMKSTDYLQSGLELDIAREKELESHYHEEDSAYLKMYLEDLKGIKESTSEEEKVLVDKIRKGDDSAKNRYIEANLHIVVKIAADYKNQGVSMEDLIQEGNMGLVSSLESVSELTDAEQGKELVTGFIRRFMKAAITEQKENSGFEETIVKKINKIRDAANELAEDLGREADIHELAGYVRMPENEVADILRMAIEGVQVDSRHGSKGKYQGDAHHTRGPGHRHNH